MCVCACGRGCGKFPINQEMWWTETVNISEMENWLKHLSIYSCEFLFRWHVLSNISLEKQQISLCAVLLLHEKYTTFWGCSIKVFIRVTPPCRKFWKIKVNSDPLVQECSNPDGFCYRYLAELDDRMMSTLYQVILVARHAGYTFEHPRTCHSWNVRLEHVCRTPCQWVQDMFQ